MLKLRYISAPKSWSHKEYSCSAYPAHSMFTFDEFWGILGLSIFRNSSSVANNTQSRLSSRLPDYLSISYDYGVVKCDVLAVSRES